jgi:hypothetical protein
MRKNLICFINLGFLWHKSSIGSVFICKLYENCRNCEYCDFLLFFYLNKFSVVRYPDNGFLLPDPFSTLYHAYHKNNPSLCIAIPNLTELELDDNINMNLSDGLAMILKKVSMEIKEVNKASSDDEQLNSEDILMATLELEIDELFDNDTAHLILAEDTGAASEGEVMGLLDGPSETPSFVNGKKGKKTEKQVKSKVQYDQDIPQYNDTFTGGDGKSSFEGFDKDKPHASMSVHSMTPDLSTVVIIHQNISLPPSPGPSNAIAGPSTIMIQSLSVSNASPSTSRGQGGKSKC